VGDVSIIIHGLVEFAMRGPYDAELKTAIAAARAAGDMLRAEFHRPGGPRGHGAHAEIDAPAEESIFVTLDAAYPEYGYRGEELPTRRRPARDAERHVWLVDPNDGTSSFLKGSRGSAVSIALLRDGRPVLGVVFAFCAPDDAGDLITWAEGCGPLRRNGRALPDRVWPQTAGSEAIVLTAEGAQRRPLGISAVLDPMRYRPVPSIAWRLALVAVGEGDLTASMHNPGDWDYGGGHALLIGAGGGGDLWDTAGRPVTYDPAEGRSSCGGRCFGGSPVLARVVADRDWSLARDHKSPAGFDGSSLQFPIRDRHVAGAGLLARAQGCLLGLIAAESFALSSAGRPGPESERALELARALLANGGAVPENSKSPGQAAIAGIYGDTSDEDARAVARAIRGEAAEETEVVPFESALSGLDPTIAAAKGALLGARHGRDCIPLAWRNAVLTYRALPNTLVPRPERLWAVDALLLAEHLLMAGEGEHPASSLRTIG
jgi:fructose-1,6-bisphosphatase/inositol monophosphatase family enzyme